MSIIVTKIVFAGIPLMFITGTLRNYIRFWISEDIEYGKTAIFGMFFFAASICMTHLFYGEDKIAESVRAIDFSSVNDAACLIEILIPVLLKVVNDLESRLEERI